MENNNFNKRVYGLVIIKSENSNFNADFTGNPRRLPDENGTIYATDKALKYAIRKYWIEDKDDNGKPKNNVFVWKSYEKGSVRTRDQRMSFMKDIISNRNKNLEKLINLLNIFEKSKKEKIEIEDEFIMEINKNFNEIIDEDFKKLLKQKNSSESNKKKVDSYIKKLNYLITATVFANSIDTKLFGVTYTGEGPLSLTGPVQISYGVNKFFENTNYTPTILSPYPTDSDSNASSIGKEHKNLKSYYVYDFSINPQNIMNHYDDDEYIKEIMQLKDSDINSLKDALKHSGKVLETTSKKGSSSVMLLWIELPENSKYFLPEMKNMIKIEEKDDDTIVNLSKLKTFLNKGENLKVELYYDEDIVTIDTNNLKNLKINNKNMAFDEGSK